MHIAQDDGWSMMVKEKENKLHKSKKSLQQKKKRRRREKREFPHLSGFATTNIEHKTKHKMKMNMKMNKNGIILLASLLTCTSAFTPFIPNHPKFTGSPLSKTLLKNIYDDWRSDGITDVMPLDGEETVQMCLDELISSKFGEQMFGIHDAPASIGITGEIALEEVAGPEVFLTLSGKFWHTRSHVLGRAAMYLNARIPEIMSVSVLERDNLMDEEELVDEETGDIMEVIDRRSPDYNGDRATMIYQGIDPDQRGPFVSTMGGDFKIIPS
jgi:hypothetical protein